MKGKEYPYYTIKNQSYGFGRTCRLKMNHPMEMQTENLMLTGSADNQTNNVSGGTGPAPTTGESKISRRLGIRSKLDF